MTSKNMQKKYTSRMHQIKQTVYKGIAILSLAMMSASSAHAAFVSMDHDVFGKPIKRRSFKIRTSNRTPGYLHIQQQYFYKTVGSIIHGSRHLFRQQHHNTPVGKDHQQNDAFLHKPMGHTVSSALDGPRTLSHIKGELAISVQTARSSGK